MSFSRPTKAGSAWAHSETRVAPSLSRATNKLIFHPYFFIHETFFSWLKDRAHAICFLIKNITCFCCSECVQHGTCCRLGFQGTQVTISSHSCSSCPLLYVILHWILSSGIWFFFCTKLWQIWFSPISNFYAWILATSQQIYVATFNRLTGSLTDTYVGQECENKVHMNF